MSDTFYEKTPVVVMVHDEDHADFRTALDNAGITSAVTLHTFVDMYPVYSEENEGLNALASEADVLMVQKSLLLNKAGAAINALAATRINPNKVRQVLLLDDEYKDPGSFFNCFERALMELPQ